MNECTCIRRTREHGQVENGGLARVVLKKSRYEGRESSEDESEEAETKE